MDPQRAAQPSLAMRLFGGDPTRRLALLRAAWPLAVGSELARRTELLEAKGGTLRVRVPDAAWRRELHRMQATLRARLRRIVGELAPARLAFQEAPPASAPALPEAASPAPAEARPWSRADPGPAPESVRRGAEVILDPEIRERFERTAARALARAAGTPSTTGERP